MTILRIALDLISIGLIIWFIIILKNQRKDTPTMVKDGDTIKLLDEDGNVFYESTTRKNK
jgi:uncharacterized protein YoxC